MGDLIISLDEEKIRLTEKSSDLYSTSVINIEEYERLIEYINKIETKREVGVIDSMIQGYRSNSVYQAPAGRTVEESAVQEDSPAPISSALKKYHQKEYSAVFSWRTTTLEPFNGKGGKFSSVFGTNRIIVDKLPPGKTVINTDTVFGMTEIIVAHNIRVLNRTEAVFSGVFGPDDLNSGDPNWPELVIKGGIVFGNLTIIRK